MKIFKSNQEPNRQAVRLHERVWQTPHLRVSNTNRIPEDAQAKFTPLWAGPRISGLSLLFLAFDGVLYEGEKRDYSRLAAVETWLRKHPSVLVVLTQPVHNAVTLDDLRPVFSQDIQSRVIGLLGKLTDQVLFIDRYAERVRAARWVALLAEIKEPHERPHWLIESSPATGVRREQLDRLSHIMLQTKQEPI